MPVNILSLANAVWILFKKDLLCEFRTGYAIGTLLMFALLILSSISMTFSGISLSAELTANLLWMIIFFCSMAGLGRAFLEEQETGTLFTLSIYFRPQAIVLGKMLYNIALLIGLTCLIVPLFMIFLHVDFQLWRELFAVLLLGDIGIGAVSTLMAAMLGGAQGKHSLFTVLTLPIILPQFLSAIHATMTILSGNVPTIQEIAYMLGYDSIMILAGYMLYSFICCE